MLITETCNILLFLKLLFSMHNDIFKIFSLVLGFSWVFQKNIFKRL